MTTRIHRPIHATCTPDATAAATQACAQQHFGRSKQTRTGWSKHTRIRAEGACPG